MRVLWMDGSALEVNIVPCAPGCCGCLARKFPGNSACAYVIVCLWPERGSCACVSDL